MVRKTGKASTSGEQESAPASHITTRAQLEQLRAQAVGMNVPQPRAAKRKALGAGGGRRQRDRADGIDDFEMELLRHGINFEDIQKAAKQYDSGTRTPYVKLAHACLRWWCTQPLGLRKVLWVDPASGYTDRNVPKLSTAVGRELVARGLAGVMWVYSRPNLLQARAWAKRMLALTPTQRLSEPVMPGEER